MVKTRIISTLGPASSSETVIRMMMRAGMDVARINFSHGRQQDILRKINIVRGLNRKYRRRIKLLGDLQGQRIRVGRLAQPLLLKKRQKVLLIQEDIEGDCGGIPFNYKGSLKNIVTGQHIFIDDGNIDLVVTGRVRGKLKAQVVIGGLLKEHKGMNIPDARLDFGGISTKDKQDIYFCIKQKAEYIAQSFVRSKNDILAVRGIIGKSRDCRVIAKIENREGIKNIDEIISVSDGIMIARGDMGVSLPIYEVPVIQKMIIKKCNRAGKFVITATQMLESMVENLRPTRAEVTDVANAIIDGTDFVMLSAESAVGINPVKTVAMMNDIIRFTERHLNKLK